MNVAEVLVEFAARLGISECFSLNGGMAMHLNKALNDNPKVSVTYTHHEQAAICSAEGYAKASNFRIPGLACVTAGPGVANSLTGLLSAFADSAPVLIFAGQVKTIDIDKLGLRTHGVQEIKSQQLVTPSVKSFYRISTVDIWTQLSLIRRDLGSGRKGPVFIEIPLDVQSESVQFAFDKLSDIFASPITNSYEIDSHAIRQIKSKLEISKKIAIYFGNGMRISGQGLSPYLEILDELHIPRFYSWLSQDLEKFGSSFNLNCPGSLAPIYSNRFLQEADLVFFLGARLDLATTAYRPDTFGASVSRVIIDVDSVELKKFIDNQADLLIEYDLSNGIDFLFELIQSTVTCQCDWSDSFVSAKEEYLRMEDKLLKSDTFSTRDLMLKIGEILDRGTLVMSSSGSAAEGAARFFRGNGEIRFFHGGGLGAMGQGLSHGIGACKARLDETEPVWILESDGGLWMNVHELATLKAIDPKNTILFIMNNGGYASIRNSQERHFGMHSGTGIDDGLVFPNWKLIAESLDINFISLEDPNNFHFERLLNLESLTIVEVKLQSAEKRGPTLKTVMTDKGPITQPLEDINWD